MFPESNFVISFKSLLKYYHRCRLEVCYEKIILMDPTYCAERNPEQSLWRTTFHQIIELCRKKLEDNTSDHAAVKEKLLDVINQVYVFLYHIKQHFLNFCLPQPPL